MAKEVNPVDVLGTFVAKYPTQRKAAEVLGVSQAYLSDMLLRRRDLSVTVLTKLGLKRAVVKVAKEKVA